MYLIRCEFEFPKTDDRLKHDTQQNRAFNCENVLIRSRENYIRKLLFVLKIVRQNLAFCMTSTI